MVFICVCVHMCGSLYTHGVQKTPWGSGFSPPTGIPGIHFMLSGLEASISTF